jgi:NAD+ synthase (glutamine-hydrolysing)
MRIGIAQINSHVGDITKNTSLIIEQSIRGRDEYNLDLIIFPELMLTGYPPEDLLYRPAFHLAVDKAIKKLTETTAKIGIIFGYPRKTNDSLYNSSIFIRDGKVQAHYDKMVLPNYGVFDEKRYFKAGSSPCQVDLGEFRAALTICEDIWIPGPAKQALESGADLIININASPFHTNKRNERRDILKQRNKETGLAIIYVNLIGGQDELVFDGGSIIIDPYGEFAFEAPQFEENLYISELHKRENKLVLKVPEISSQHRDNDEVVYLALVQAVKDYVIKNHFKGVLIGLSGGIDSALVTCIATSALGKENVEVVLMPSQYTADISMEDSITLANNLGVKHYVIPIEQPFSAFTDALAPLFEGMEKDLTEENIQARCRGIILMAISNKTGKLVLATGNKSEMAVGYATLYGDMVGGYAPLKDVSKLMVYRLANYLNRHSVVIPERIITRPPTAELREDQKDEDSLPPYDILDPILERYIELDQTPQQIIEQGYNRDDVLKVTCMVDQSEYKRRQAAPGVKISKRAFGRERRYPITSGYKES